MWVCDSVPFHYYESIDGGEAITTTATTPLEFMGKKNDDCGVWTERPTTTATSQSASQTMLNSQHQHTDSAKNK